MSLIKSHGELITYALNVADNSGSAYHRLESLKCAQILLNELVKDAESEYEWAKEQGLVA